LAIHGDHAFYGLSELMTISGYNLKTNTTISGVGLQSSSEDNSLANQMLSEIPRRTSDENRNLALKRLRQLETLMFDTKSQMTELKGCWLLETWTYRPSDDAFCISSVTAQDAGPLVPTVRGSPLSYVVASKRLGALVQVSRETDTSRSFEFKGEMQFV
jgi:hypothetical protein